MIQVRMQITNASKTEIKKDFMLFVLCIVIQLSNVTKKCTLFKLTFQFNSWCLLHVLNIMHSSSGRPLVHAVFKVCFSCIYVSSLAGGRMCVILDIKHILPPAWLRYIKKKECE